MLQFTARGAVRTPVALQIRVGAFEPGALRAGAPEPTRDLAEPEISQNLRHFTAGLRTTRTRPCTRLALSGCSQIDLTDVVREARGLGVEQVIVHGRSLGEGWRAADRIVIRAQTVRDLDALPNHANLTVVVPAPDASVELTAALCQARPAHVALRWPYPSGGDRPSLAACRVGVARALERLETAGLSASFTGLPACLTDASKTRTRNRYYVDADHQLTDALLFFPDIVELAKPDTCRSCAHTAWCDGVARTWLDRGTLGVLQPIASGGSLG